MTATVPTKHWDRYYGHPAFVSWPDEQEPTEVLIAGDVPLRTAIAVTLAAFRDMWHDGYGFGIHRVRPDLLRRHHTGGGTVTVLPVEPAKLYVWDDADVLAPLRELVRRGPWLTPGIWQGLFEHTLYRSRLVPDGDVPRCRACGGAAPCGWLRGFAARYGVKLAVLDPAGPWPAIGDSRAVRRPEALAGVR